MTTWLCRMKKAEGKLTEWDQRQISEYFRNMAMSYNLEYIIVIKKE